jgi:hypothetical protein
MNSDRKYDASKFAEYFASFIGNGVFPESLQVVSNNNLTVTVKAGKAWINGYIMINDADYILNINVADGVLNRIDRIVLRYDVIDREIRLEVKQGAFAGSPVEPVLQRDTDAYELCLADITISAGAVSITQEKILDTRLDSNLCGKVDTLIAGDFLSLSEAVNNKVDKAANSKDLTVTFTEATSDEDIASGDTHSTLFGKILKNLNSLRDSIYNIVNGGTTVGKAVTLNGLFSTIAELNFVKGVTSAIQTQLNGKAPTNHASTGTGYGVGDASNYGHVKVRNDLIGTETSGATVSPAQIKVLNEKLLTAKPVLLATIPLNLTTPVDIQNYLNNGNNPYDEYIFKLEGSITIQNTHTSNAIEFMVGLDSGMTLPQILGCRFQSITVPKTSTHTCSLAWQVRTVPTYRAQWFGSRDYATLYTSNGQVINVAYSANEPTENSKVYFRPYIPNGGYLTFSANTIVLKIYGINYAL